MLVPRGPIRAGLLSLIIAVPLALLAGPVASASAALLVMEKPTNGTVTKVTTPTFSGTSEDLEDPVTVVIHEGSSLSGPTLSPPLSTSVSEEGTWSVTAEALAEGTYTAEAEQTETAGMGQTNTAGPVTFTIDDKPPKVTLKQPTSPSGDTTPIFEGTASESSTVTIDVYAGSKAEGGIVASATAEGTGDKWTSKKASPALSGGEYTAVASQESSIGNGPGESEPVHFVVDTETPEVKLNLPKTPSKDTTPSFTGTASGHSEVVIHIYEGAEARGTEVASAEAPGTGGGWASDDASPALKSGYHEYTAVATQEDPVDHLEGKSEPKTFVVDTEAPGVTLSQPAKLSNDTEPSFSGTATGTAEVVVKIYAGSKAEGVTVATATAPPPGAGNSWSSGQAGPALATGRHTYTAVATEESPLGNEEGKSEPRTFEVDTEAPTVTLKQPAKLSGETRPSFSGTASEATEVVVHVYEGTKAEGAELASAKTTASGGNWSTSGSELSKALPNGRNTFTAVATEKSGLDNADGRSEERTFEVETNPPTVTLNQPPKLSGNTEPSFSGSASEATEVIVHVYEGSKAEGGEVASAKTTAAGGSWSTTGSQLSNALKKGRHTYTAVATEKSGVSGNPEGRSEERTFEVNTETPTVTLNQPSKLSKDTTPSFSGTASEPTEVVVRVYEGTKAEGTEVAAASTIAAGGSWSTTGEQLSQALPSGRHTFTAVAKEKSGLDNGEGRSEERTFEVDTEAPTVKLNQPAKLSGETRPAFSGTASEATEVVVSVYEGDKVEGSAVATAAATASGGSWSTTGEQLSNALPSGRHTFTAVAREKSGLGNTEGVSEERIFEVNTNPPIVTLNQPAKLSGETKPSFSGSASEATEVVVRVYEGTKVEGSAVATAKTTAAGGSWSTTGEQLSQALPSGKHTFTAVAREKSGLGNTEGVSEERTFEVNTNPPTVTLNQPAKLSGQTKPSFSGSASEATEVVVHVYEGTKAGGTEVASAKTTAAGGSWSTTGEQLSKALPTGKHTFTAVAKEKSGLGDGEGVSEERTFEVDTNPPTVTLAKVSSPTSDTTPSFSGSASEATEVVVRVYEGSKVEGSAVATATTTASGGSWATTGEQLSNALPSGRHTFTAVAKEKSGLGDGEGVSEERSFEVDTEPPTVTLTRPEARTKATEPSFSGTASENTEVVVHVLEGSTEVAKAKTTASGGTWATSVLSKPLSEGKHAYTVYATEKSGLTGNKEGTSETWGFEVDTEPPVVTLAPVPGRTSETRPSFSGTASENTEVVVHVFEGSNEIAKAKTMASNGSWSTNGSALSKALPEGEHTFSVYATEKSGLGNSAGTSAPQSFEVDTEPPTVTLAKVPSPTNDTTPTFNGAASEATEVVVHVYEGTKAGGTEVASAKTTASGGGWSTTVQELTKALPAGKRTYTAVAVEKSGLGNSSAESEERTFEVNTEPPKVSLSKVASPTNDTTPSFSGTGGEPTEVVVRVYEGAKAEGTPIATAKTTASGGNWSTTGEQLTPALPKGKHTFTAVAMEKSGLNNPEGRSEERTFEVNTEPPKVTLNTPTTPSKETKPSFGGTASENTEVVVHVFEGSKAEGTEVASAKTTASSGSWTTTGAELSKALSEGTHTFTAVAIEKSGVGNKEGTSEERTFVVNTEPPKVTLNTPTTPSKETKPSFSGTASEATEVVVHVFAGSKGEGEEVASAKTTAASGSWTTTGTELSKALSEGKNMFSAYATEVSGLGNKAGKSSTVVFEVDTEPPTVTLEPPKTPSNNRRPSFSGKASEATEVVVEVFEGSTEVASAKTTASGGAWSTTSEELSKTLAEGKHEFTAVAFEKSGLGNGEGKSKPVSFEVDTVPPAVAFNPLPPRRSNETKPSFSGTASEAGTVTVQLYRGEMATGTPLDTLKALVSEGKWTTVHVNPLEDGKYTVIAKEPSALGNEEGASEAATFEVSLGAPTVHLNELARSRNTEPSFSGTAEEKTPVTVEVYEGNSATGRPVATATEHTREGKIWISGKVSPPLKAGRHSFTAVAVQASELGNPSGESNPVTFEVDTEAPTVTLDPPQTLSNQTKPSFSGAAGEDTEVIVRIFEGAIAQGQEVASAKTTASGGSWTTNASELSKPLSPGNHTFTAVAAEKSGLGNKEGRSEERTFEVNTEPPVVTLDEVPSPSNNPKPSFSGEASEGTPITVVVYRAGSGELAGTVPAEVVDGKWVSTKASAPQLENGEYWAEAWQESAIGNGRGMSSRVPFTVQSRPPSVVAEATVLDTRSSATMYASIDPNGGTLSACDFEYGKTPSFGSGAACAFIAGSSECEFVAGVSGVCAFPSGESPVQVYARVFNLSAGATYYFRIKAADEGNAETPWAEGTFTIPPPLVFGGGPGSGSSGGSPSNATTSKAHNAVGEVEAEIAAHLPPSGRNATTAALLKHGGFASVFKAPKAGTATIDWWYLPTGAKLSAKAANASKKKAPAPVLVATGRRTFYEAGSGVIKVRLTAAGRSLLKRSKHVRLTAKAVFTASGKTLYAASKSFELK